MKKFVVFIPAFNAAKTLVETLDGIADAAAYLKENVVVCIYDDYSSDDTYEIAKAYVSSNLILRVFRNTDNLGERKTINLGFSELSKIYDWAFIIHADDIPKKEWLKTLMDIIDKCNDSRVFTVWSSYDSFNDQSNRICLGDNGGEIAFFERKPSDANYFITKVTASWHVSGAGINLSLFELIGQFDTTMPQYGDTDFFARGILAGYSDVYIKQTLTNYRVLQSSVSFVSKKTNRDILEMFHLANKFALILKSKEKRSIFGLAFRYSLRRSLKYILFRKFKSFSKVFPLVLTCVKKYFLLR